MDDNPGHRTLAYSGIVSDEQEKLIEKGRHNVLIKQLLIDSRLFVRQLFAEKNFVAWLRIPSFAYIAEAVDERLKAKFMDLNHLYHFGQMQVAVHFKNFLKWILKPSNFKISTLSLGGLPRRGHPRLYHSQASIPEEECHCPDRRAWSVGPLHRLARVRDRL